MSENQNKILKMLRDRHGSNYHPLLELADIAMDEKTDVKTKVDCHKTIVKYVESELKSVEVKGNVKADFGTLTVKILGDEDESDPEPEPEAQSD